MENLKEIQVAGLLHDIGKFVRKYNGGKGKHAVLSGEFIALNKNLCIRCDIDKVIGLVAAHHSDDSKSFSNSVGVNIEHNKVVSAAVANEVYALAKNADKDLLKILTMADSLAASSDRRSETGIGTSGHCEYAPLWSPIGQVFGKRLAVRSGHEYKVYNYQGENDLKETVKLNDSNFENNVIENYKQFKQGIDDLTDDIEILLGILDDCWSTVNANTWRPAGSTIGNTTTSLYDHSKLTSAIAGCLLINKNNGVKISIDNPNIDVWHVLCTGDHDINCEIAREIDNLELSSACVIGCADAMMCKGKEIYFIYPSSETEKLIENTRELNNYLYSSYGETINFEIARNWKFKNCDKSLHERFNERFIGILDVVNKLNVREPLRGIGCGTFGEDEPFYEEGTFAGFKINHYDYILDSIVRNNDSISKLATTLRVFTDFSAEIEAYLRENKCYMQYESFDNCIYSIDKNKIHQIEKGIAEIYRKYVGDCIGLTFSNITTSRFSDAVDLLNSELDTYSKNRKIEDNESYVKIESRYFKIKAIDLYTRITNKASKVSKNTLFKIIKLYDEILQYADDNNAEHLVSLSKFQYLIANEADENSKQFEQECLQVVYDADKDKIKPSATIYYEAIVVESRRKR